jgi:hypothetical protein
MNERLRQLMVQADYPAPEIALRAQKLAELIVRECAGVAIDNGCGDFVDIKQKLFEHFGVEE